MAEKKKPSFSIKPFKRRNTKPKTIQVDVRAERMTNPVQELAPPVQVATPIVEEPDPKPIIKPLNRKNKLNLTSTGSVSLSSLFDEETTTKESEHTGDESLVEEKKGPEKEFTKEEFTLAWKDFAHQLKEQGNMSMYNTLVADIPNLDGGVIQMKISNSVQQLDIGKMRVDLLDHLKSTLENYSLSLDVELIKDDSNKISLYSDKDKYDAMVKQNPALDAFRKKLNLDLEM